MLLAHTSMKLCMLESLQECVGGFEHYMTELGIVTYNCLIAQVVGVCVCSLISLRKYVK